METKRIVSIEKMQGAGNVFFVIDERPPLVEPHDRYDRLARVLCAWSGAFGGADGLLVIGDAPGFAAEMRIFNADGSEAEMCGNGVRCVVRYLAERGAGDAFVIKTLAGPIAAQVLSHGPDFAARINIGLVHFPNGYAVERLVTRNTRWSFHYVSVGNPHVVLFVDEPHDVDLVELGRVFNSDERFPNGTNVHLAQIVDSRAIVVRHFERGVGLTLACGTGAVAAAAAAVRLHDMESPVTVRVPGGTLVVEWSPGEEAWLTGPAETVFSRTIEI
jgi:diaminopimelate epimerase